MGVWQSGCQTSTPPRLSPVANRSDEAEALAEELGVRFYRVSVKDNLNVDEVFEYLADEYLKVCLACGDQGGSSIDCLSCMLNRSCQLASAAAGVVRSACHVVNGGNHDVRKGQEVGGQRDGCGCQRTVARSDRREKVVVLSPAWCVGDGLRMGWAKGPVNCVVLLTPGSGGDGGGMLHATRRTCCCCCCCCSW